MKLEPGPRWLAAGRWFAVLATVNVVVLAVVYMAYPGYIDHGESAISAMAWKMLGGHPVYHSFDDADRITNIYGPFVYLWHAWPLALFGGSVQSSKVAAMIAAILIPGAAWAIAGRRDALAGWLVAFVGVLVIVHLNAPMVVRPDAMLVGMVSVSVLAVLWSERTARGWATTLLIGIAAGIAVNIKIHAAVYLAPIALFHVWGDWRRLPVMALTAAVVAAAPFGSRLFPLADYLVWFGPMGAKENVWMGFAILWWKFLLYFLPALLLGLGGRNAWAKADPALRVYLGTYLAALVLVLFPATKVGAGDQYYMPFMPLVLDLSLRVLALGGRAARQRLAVILVVLTAAGASYQPERRFFKKQEWQLSAKVVDEIEQIMKDHPGKRIQMGVGRVPTERGDQLSFHFYVWHNLLVFAGNPYTIETSIMFELTKLGVPFPPAALDRFKTCDTQIWLVPKGGRPFFIQGYYLEPVFPKELVDGFKDNHHLIESRDIFDLWECTPVQ